MAKARVFVDTNVIIEAFRCKVWNELCARFQVETVPECVREALAGNPEHPEYEKVDAVALHKGLAVVNTVSELDRAKFRLSRPEAEGLDSGESDLLAFIDLNGLNADCLILLSTSDRAAVVTAGGFGWSDSLVSLEWLLEQCGANKKAQGLRHHFTKRWLSVIKTDLTTPS